MDSQLFATAGEAFTALKQQVWAAVDDEINLNNCDVYRSAHGVIRIVHLNNYGHFNTTRFALP